VTWIHIILPFTPRSVKWSYSIRLSCQSPICISLLFRVFCILPPSDPLFDHPSTNENRSWSFSLCTAA